MKTQHVVAILAGVATTAAFATGTTDSGADSINLFFAHARLFIAGINSLVDPLKGLAESVGALALVVGAIYLRLVAKNQKVAKADRADQAVTLAAQNAVLAQVSDSVETVKAAVAPPVGSVPEQPKEEIKP